MSFPLNMSVPFSCFRFEEDLDDYSVIMVKALADRLAEVSILSQCSFYTCTSKLLSNSSS